MLRPPRPHWQTWMQWAAIRGNRAGWSNNSVPGPHSVQGHRRCCAGYTAKRTRPYSQGAQDPEGEESGSVIWCRRWWEAVRDMHTRTETETTLSLLQENLPSCSQLACLGSPSTRAEFSPLSLGKNSPGERLCPGLLAVDREWPSKLGRSGEKLSMSHPASLLLAHWGQGACCLSCFFPPASCKGHASCGRESCSCSPHERCGSHWGRLPAVLSPLFPLAEDGGSLHPRMKCSKLGKVSSPPLWRTGHGVLSWLIRCKGMSGWKLLRKDFLTEKKESHHGHLARNFPLEMQVWE